METASTKDFPNGSWLQQICIYGPSMLSNLFRLYNPDKITDNSGVGVIIGSGRRGNN